MHSSDLLASPLPGQSINPSTMLDKAVCNVIASLIFARRFEYEDPYLIRMLKVLQESFTEISGFIPTVGGSVQPTAALLCSLSSPGGGGELCAMAVGEAIWWSTAGGYAC